MSAIHYKILVSGKVQGVWFRASARDRALELGLKGFVRNEPDGSVYAEVEGPAEAVSQFLDWCRQGPPQARIDQVSVEEAPPQGFKDFQIQR